MRRGALLGRRLQFYHRRLDSQVLASRPSRLPATIVRALTESWFSVLGSWFCDCKEHTMDFRFSPEEESFRDEVRGFIRAELPANWEGADPYGADAEGSSPYELGRKITKKL